MARRLTPAAWSVWVRRWSDWGTGEEVAVLLTGCPIGKLDTVGEVDAEGWRCVYVGARGEAKQRAQREMR